MSLDIAIYEDKLEPVVFVFMGETVNAKAFLYKITPEYQSRLRSLGRRTAAGDETPTAGAEARKGKKGDEKKPAKRSEPRYVNSDAEMIAELMPEWDIVLNGQPFPPTRENVARCPEILLACASLAMLREVGKLSMASALKSTPSDSPSEE